MIDVLKWQRDLPARGGLWMVSFGDLLTLLLCLFLLEFSNESSKLHPDIPQSDVTVEKSRPLTEPGLARHGTPNSGTLLAPYDPGVPVIEHRFQESEFDLGTGRVRKQALSHLESLVIPDGYLAKQVFITTCSASTGGSEVSHWNVARARATYLHGQLIDRGFEPERLAVQVLGAHCGVLKGAEKTPTAGLVRVELQKI